MKKALPNDQESFLFITQKWIETVDYGFFSSGLASGFASGFASSGFASGLASSGLAASPSGLAAPPSSGAAGVSVVSAAGVSAGAGVSVGLVQPVANSVSPNSVKSVDSNFISVLRFLNGISDLQV
ncbi:hypothetical protein [uncultured Gimesia sp.]|uniref:hypothetical protein n=1 Tax=uncultured Gimesia sp. TaxID=1678688 RepID=UPI0030DAFE5E